MAGLFALSINPNIYADNFLKELFWGTFYEQHLGEEYCGLSTYDGGEIKIRTHHGLFRQSFVDDLTGLEGQEGIGYCGSAREPYFAETKIGKFSIGFSGNVINLPEICEELKTSGHSFGRGDDVELITKLLAIQGDDFLSAIKGMSAKIYGSYVLFLLSEQGIWVVRCPYTRWPAVIGVKKGAVAAATESAGFGNLGFELVRDINPGEIVLLKNGEWQSVGSIVSNIQPQICSFLWVYTAFPNSIFEGITASSVRKNLGRALARKDIQNGFIPDIVSPVPDSGRFHAIGYHQEFCLQAQAGKINKIPLYDEVLLKYPYAGRSYTPSTQQARNLEAEIKMLESGDNYKNKVLVVCDDSIVRGTQTQNHLVPKLKKLGFSEIHFRISNPELLSHCKWGKTTKKGEMLASTMPSIQERVVFLGVNGLVYNTIEDLIEAIGLPMEELCLDCDL